jgi:uncharacterized protein
MYSRFISKPLRETLAATRVVLLNGARQTGKSTLVQQVAQERGGRYITLDDAAVLGLARSDPAALVRGASGLTVIDEVQHAPGLFPEIKMEVDRAQRPGQFLLTGSADVLLLPSVSESLAGRMEILSLKPLSQDEILGRPALFVEALFGQEQWQVASMSVERADICRRIVAGGFPEPLGRESEQRRAAWFKAYITSLLQRDVRDLANIEGLTDMPRLLSLLAARVGGLMNMAEISRTAGIPHTTLRRYLSLLEMTFILQPLPAWSGNLGKRLARSPKIHLVDTGLAAHLRGEADVERLVLSPSLGPLLESFVLQELRKQLDWSATGGAAYHYRTTAGQEVDMVLESPGLGVVGIEVKASAVVTSGDFRGLRSLKEAAGSSFVRGVVVYLGDKILSFGDSLWAVPVSRIWEEEHRTVR